MNGSTAYGSYSIGGGYTFYSLIENGFRGDLAFGSLSGGKVNLNSSTPIAWSSTGAWYNGADTGLSRISAGVVGVGNGTAGNISGTIQAGAATLTAQTTASTPLTVTGTANQSASV